LKKPKLLKLSGATGVCVAVTLLTVLLVLATYVELLS